MALTTRKQVREVKRLLAGQGVMTLDQLSRLGLHRGVEALGLHPEPRTASLNRSPRVLTPIFTALDRGTLVYQPTSRLKHLALLADGARRIGLSPVDWLEVRTHASGATPDAVWIRGPGGAGMDWALEVDTTYPWSTVQRKFEDFGPSGLRFPGSLRSAAHLGFPGVVWMVTSHLRQGRIGEWLQATAGFRPVGSGPTLPVGVRAFVWSGSGRSFEVWVVSVEL